LDFGNIGIYNFIGAFGELSYFLGAFSKSSQVLIFSVALSGFLYFIHGILTGNNPTSIDGVLTFIYYCLFIEFKYKGKVYSAHSFLGSRLSKYIDLILLITKLVLMSIFFKESRDFLIMIAAYFLYLVPRQKELYREKLYCGVVNLLWCFYFVLGSFYLEFLTQIAVAATYFIKSSYSYRKEKK